MTVDHGLQPGSADRARADRRPAGRPGPGPRRRGRGSSVGTDGGPEGAARSARYDGPAAAAADHGARIALGHTLDDQAETVLLGLGRGSGPRSVAGMVEDRPPYWRPLLGVRRETTRQACADQGLPVWDDPWNDDPAYTRVRLRTRGAPAARGRARRRGRARARPHGGAAPRGPRRAGRPRGRSAGPPAAEGGADGGLPARELAELPAALRRRVLRGWLRGSGVPDLQAVHLAAVDALLTRVAGPGPGRPAGRRGRRPGVWQAGPPSPRGPG